ncbi:MAG: hypothetical protein Q4C18_03005 [Eubacteriales bacterium]|nr:hypothetical protein [Eubacteriales bacterium]
MKFRKTKEYLIIAIVIAMSCFLTYGVTQAYVEAKYEAKYVLTNDDYYGTYLLNDGKNKYIIIEASDKSEGKRGRVTLRDNQDHRTEIGTCEISKERIITIQRKDGAKEYIVFTSDKNTAYYITQDREPVKMKKEFDAAI